ncbi:hypothetical protein Tco_0316705 [Tanacetum coccineum]
MLLDSFPYLDYLKLDHCYLLPISLPELFVSSHGGTMTTSLMHQWHDTICGDVISPWRSLLYGAYGCILGKELERGNFPDSLLRMVFHFECLSKKSVDEGFRIPKKVDRNGRPRIKGTSLSADKSDVAVEIDFTWSLGFVSVEPEARISLMMFEFSSCLLADSAMNLASASSIVSLRAGYEEFLLLRW